jgi:hypothetical protein
MASKKKLLQAAAGSAGGAGLDVDEVFSTYLYDGNSSTQTITNGIDLSGEGGLVWTKTRNESAYQHWLFDTERGATKRLFSALDSAEATISNGLTSFNSNGFTVGAYSGNETNDDIVSWTFRKAPKWFDIVTYTGNTVGGSAQTISHGLGSNVGMIIVKRYSTADNWVVWHRYNANAVGFLNLTNQFSTTNASSFISSVSSTSFTVGESLNTNGESFVAYLFAHNDGDGDFGPNGDQDIIKCGSYTGTGSEVDINLGFEPQWILTRRADDPDDWYMVDTMRGIVTSGNDVYLRANLSSAEGTGVDIFDVTSTGFKTKVSARHTSGGTYIYMAIRRGPLAAPESATDVFDVDINTQAINSSNAPPRTPFPVDMGIYKARDASGTAWPIFARLQGANYLQTQATDVEGSGYTTWDQMDGWGISTASWESSANYVFYNWKRAPSYFDVCCYSGTGSARTVGHNLTVPPEMMWIKRRSAAENWAVYHSALGNNKVILLQSNGAAYSDSAFNNTTPTNSVFSVSNATETNASGSTYIAYLFATVAGVSKVGSFSHTNGSATNVDCGFSNGARFIIIKRTDSTSDWRVFDSERGIVAGNDNYLLLNDTDAEAVYDFVDPLSSGFTVASNYDTGDYIFYAIA